MKKKLTLYFLCGIVSLLLIGCGSAPSKESTTKSSSSEKTSEETTKAPATEPKTTQTPETKESTTESSNEQSSVSISFHGYKISISSLWIEQQNSADSMTYKTDDATMMIKYNSESYDLTNELIQKSAIDGFVSSFDDYVSVDTKVSTIGEVPGVIHSFELSLNSIPATGKFAIFSDGENGSCGIMYVSKKDTKTDYANDFDSMISSVVPETSAE